MSLQLVSTKIVTIVYLCASQPKVKALYEFTLDSIHSRMATIGYDLYEVKLPSHIAFFEVRRVFVSKNYGGNCVETFPSISAKNFARHGMDDFMFLTCDYNPYAPQIPGGPGLSFECCDLPAEAVYRQKTRRVFTRIHDGWWQYLGQYTHTKVDNLTVREWLSQPQSVSVSSICISNRYIDLFVKVRNTWAKGILQNEWGVTVRARLTLRKELRREPTDAEVSIAIESKNKFKNVTPEAIMREYDEGREVSIRFVVVFQTPANFQKSIQAINVWAMKCVGYDEAFQMELYNGHTT